MGVRLKTVGGNVNWLQPYMMAAQITAHSNDALGEAFASGGAAIGKALTHKSDVAHADQVREEENAREDSIRAESNARSDARYADQSARSDSRHAEDLQVKLLSESRLRDDAAARSLAPAYKADVAAAQNLQERLAAGEPVQNELATVQGRLKDYNGTFGVLNNRTTAERTKLDEIRGLGRSLQQSGAVPTSTPTPDAENNALRERVTNGYVPTRGGPPPEMPPPVLGEESYTPTRGGPPPEMPPPVLGKIAADAAAKGANKPKPVAVDPERPAQADPYANDPEMRIATEIARIDSALAENKDRIEKAQKLKSTYLLGQANDTTRTLMELKATREVLLGRAKEEKQMVETARKARVMARTLGTTAGLSEDKIMWAEVNATSEEHAKALIAGMKPSKPELTPEQEGRKQAVKDRATADERVARGLDPDTGNPKKPVTEADWNKAEYDAHDKIVKSAMGKYDDRLDMDSFTTDEVAALAESGDLSENVRAKFQPELDRRLAGIHAKEATGRTAGAIGRNPFAGGRASAAPAKPAAGGANPKARASAEFDALPEAQQTKAAWLAIKRKHGL